MEAFFWDATQLPRYTRLDGLHAFKTLIEWLNGYMIFLCIYIYIFSFPQLFF